MRKHGFQRPFHKFQILSSTLAFISFSLYYIFFVPLTKDLVQYILATIYTIGLLSAFYLWTKCTLSDPTDYSDTKEKWCTICLMNVRYSTRHCRRCNRCTAYFDHHCKWLNNCIANSNYRSFLALCLKLTYISGLHFSTGLYIITSILK